MLCIIADADGTTITTVDVGGIIANLCAVAAGIGRVVVDYLSYIAHITAVAVGCIRTIAVVGGCITSTCADVDGIG